MNASRTKRGKPGKVCHYRRYAREWAMKFLFQYDVAGLTEADIDDALGRFWEYLDSESDPIENRDIKRGQKAAEVLIRGVFSCRDELDRLIAEHSDKWDVDRMDAVDRNVMRVAIYELTREENVPPLVCIDEAVEIGKTFGSENTGAFVIGILNAIKNAIVPASDRKKAAATEVPE